MASTGEEDNDAVLSDLEADDPLPINITSPSPDDVSVEKFREILTELDRERQARLAAENSKSELQVSFNRLKVLAHEALKKRDEVSRQRDEASRTVEKMNEELNEAIKQKDDYYKQLEEVKKAKELMRTEMETSGSMLVSGIDKISGKVSNFKNFVAGGLPRSQKYTGLPAVAYGVIKRTNEIVEELLRQIEDREKTRNEAREQVEHRNYEIAIEVSQLEATISGLRENVAKKDEKLSELEKCVGEKDEKLSELERETSEKQNTLESEVVGLRELVSEYESKLEVQRSLLAEQLKYVAKIHEQIYSGVKIVDVKKASELSESLFLAQEMDMEENIRAVLAGLDSIYELSEFVVSKTRDLLEERSHEVKSLNESVFQLVKEKEQIGSLLRSALSKRTSVDLSSKTNELFKIAENGLREAGINYKFSNRVGDGKITDSDNEKNEANTEEDEVYALAGALENIIKQSQVEIIDLKHTVEELRAESSVLKEHVETQAKELGQWKQRVEDLEEKERVANENVEGLMLDITAAEEEITRWKVAAQQEAAAGKAVEQECAAQLSAVRQELKAAKEAVVESEKKLKFKEETAAAAMAARDAAEKSLRLADLRASRLRDRAEELTRQLEELDGRETSRTGLNRPRYICWPWQWLGLDLVGARRIETTQQDTTNEMELSEPLL